MRNRIVTAVKQRFSIRKLSIGAASVLLGDLFVFYGGQPLLYTLILTYQGMLIKLKPAKMSKVSLRLLM